MNLDRFPGVNAGFVLELYERFRQNPESVDPATRAIFAQWTPADVSQVPPAGDTSSDPIALHIAVGAANLAESIRRYGHLAAHLDPLGSLPGGDPSLAPEAHGISEDDLRRLPATLVSGPSAASQGSAHDAIAHLREVYCSTTG